MSEEEARMSFLDHLGEFRTRLIRGICGLVVTSIACLYFSDRIFQALVEPVKQLLPPDATIVFTSLPGPFIAYLKVALIAGLMLSLPFILYQLWAFIRPGLYPHERKLAIPFIVTATLLFFGGAAFAYFLVFPAAFKFFLSYSSADLKPMIDVRDYVGLVLVLMASFGAAFETPIVIIFLGLLGVYESATLKKGRRYFIVIAFIVAAVLTPTPDVINQTLMALPMMLFYEIGIVVLAMFERKRARELGLEEPPAETDAPAS